MNIELKVLCAFFILFPLAIPLVMVFLDKFFNDYYIMSQKSIEYLRIVLVKGLFVYLLAFVTAYAMIKLILW